MRNNGADKINEPVTIRRVVRFQLKPDKVEEYISRHKNVPKELEKLYAQAGIVDLSCFVLGNELIVYVELEKDKHQLMEGWLKEQSIERRWQEEMSELRLPSSRIYDQEVYRLTARQDKQ